MDDIKQFVDENISKRINEQSENLFNESLIRTNQLCSTNSKIDNPYQSANKLKKLQALLFRSVSHETDEYNYSSWNVLVDTDKMLYMERRNCRKSTKTCPLCATIHNMDHDKHAGRSVFINEDNEVRKDDIKQIFGNKKYSKLKSKKQGSNTRHSESTNRRDSNTQSCMGQNINTIRYSGRIDDSITYRVPNNTNTYDTYKFHCSSEFCLIDDLDYKNECSCNDSQRILHFQNSEAPLLYPVELANLGTDQTPFDPVIVNSSFDEDSTSESSEDLFFAVETDETKLFTASELNEETGSNLSLPLQSNSTYEAAYENIPQKSLSEKFEVDCDKTLQRQKIAERTPVDSEKPVKRITLDEYRRRLAENVTLNSDALRKGDACWKLHTLKWIEKDKTSTICSYEYDSDNENSEYESN